MGHVKPWILCLKKENDFFRHLIGDMPRLCCFYLKKSKNVLKFSVKC